MLSQCVQYHNISKFTAAFQHFPFIALYGYGDAHWSWQIILFIIEHYSMLSLIRFISCPARMSRGIWTDIREDIKERIQRDNIREEHFIWAVGGINVCCAWEKRLTFSWWYRLTSSYSNTGADSKTCLTFDLSRPPKPPDHLLAGIVNASGQVKMWNGAVVQQQCCSTTGEMRKISNIWLDLCQMSEICVSLLCRVVHCTLTFCHINKCVFEWRILLEELMAEHGSV